jgi:hypothetical protein
MCIVIYSVVILHRQGADPCGDGAQPQQTGRLQAVLDWEAAVFVDCPKGEHYAQVQRTQRQGEVLGLVPQ